MTATLVGEFFGARGKAAPSTNTLPGRDRARELLLFLRHVERSKGYIGEDDAYVFGSELKDAIKSDFMWTYNGYAEAWWDLTMQGERMLRLNDRVGGLQEVLFPPRRSLPLVVRDFFSVPECAKRKTGTGEA